MPTGPTALRAAQPGERWVVRIRLPDGSATDLMGWLDSVTADQVQLSEVGGRTVVARTTDVIAARRAPAALGGPDPQRVSAAELERHALRGWLALHQPLGEWVLRAGGGFTGRANSAQAIGDPGMPLPVAADRVIAYAAEHGIAPMAQVIDSSAEQARLRQLGWTDTHQPSDVLVVRLAALLGDSAVDPRVRVEATLTDAWRAAYQLSRPNRADPAVLEMILDGQPPRAFASVVANDETVGIARGHLSGDWLGLASIWVRPDQRRRGLGTAMMRALGHWAARQGTRYGYLQVAAANREASAAYGRLGFRRHHGYGYLKP